MGRNISVAKNKRTAQEATAFIQTRGDGGLD